MSKVVIVVGCIVGGFIVGMGTQHERWKRVWEERVEPQALTREQVRWNLGSLFKYYESSEVVKEYRLDSPLKKFKPGDFSAYHNAVIDDCEVDRLDYCRDLAECFLRDCYWEHLKKLPEDQIRIMVGDVDLKSRDDPPHEGIGFRPPPSWFHMLDTEDDWRSLILAFHFHRECKELGPLRMESLEFRDFVDRWLELRVVWIGKRSFIGSGLPLETRGLETREDQEGNYRKWRDQARSAMRVEGIREEDGPRWMKLISDHVEKLKERK